MLDDLKLRFVLLVAVEALARGLGMWASLAVSEAMELDAGALEQEHAERMAENGGGLVDLAAEFMGWCASGADEDDRPGWAVRASWEHTGRSGT